MCLHHRVLSQNQNKRYLYEAERCTDVSALARFDCQKKNFQEMKKKTMFTAEDYSRINKQNGRIAFLESSKMILDLGSRYATT